MVGGYRDRERLSECGHDQTVLVSPANGRAKRPLPRVRDDRPGAGDLRGGPAYLGYFLLLQRGYRSGDLSVPQTLWVKMGRRALESRV